jgi:hypothetical protein
VEEYKQSELLILLRNKIALPKGLRTTYLKMTTYIWLSNGKNRPPNTQPNTKPEAYRKDKRGVLPNY